MVGTEPSLSNPTVQIAILCLCLFSNAVWMSVPFSFAPWLVVDTGMAVSEAEAGWYSGFISAAFMFGRMLTAVAWGRWSDRHGRRPVVLCAAASSTICALLFAFSLNFWACVALRVASGMLNALISTAKTAVSEIYPTGQGKAMGVVLAMWGMGMTFGSAAGGLLARPGFIGDGLLAHFPYAAPALFSCVLSMAALLAAWLGFKETRATTSKVSDVKDDSHMSQDSMSVILAYCVLSTYVEVVNEIYPLWAATPRSLSGLEDGPWDIGIVLCLSGIVQTLSQFAYAPIDRRLGPRRTLIMSSLLQVPLLMLLPLAGHMRGVASRIFSAFCFASYNMFKATAFTSSAILINNSAASSQRGMINGWSMALASTGKAGGPLVGAPLFAAALAMPFGAVVVWWICGGFALAVAVKVQMLPKRLDRPLGEYSGITTDTLPAPDKIGRNKKEKMEEKHHMCKIDDTEDVAGTAGDEAEHAMPTVE